VRFQGKRLSESKISSQIYTARDGIVYAAKLNGSLADTEQLLEDFIKTSWKNPEVCTSFSDAWPKETPDQTSIGFGYPVIYHYKYLLSLYRVNYIYNHITKLQATF
jgi:hypothetical protein